MIRSRHPEASGLRERFVNHYYGEYHMNTGQTMLTLGAMVLITMIILNFNRMMNHINQSLNFNRFRLEALSIMTSHVEQLSQLFFDEASTDTTSEKRINDFTSSNMLGFEVNDNSIVDDIDDLNGLTVADTGISGVLYNVDYNVDYITLQNNLIVHSDNKQYHKRISIEVSDAYDPPLIYTAQGDSLNRDTLKISVVISYWFYN